MPGVQSSLFVTSRPHGLSLLSQAVSIDRDLNKDNITLLHFLSKKFLHIKYLELHFCSNVGYTEDRPSEVKKVLRELKT